MSMLDTYLKDSGTRQEDFAAIIGVKQATVSRLKRGLLTPSLSLAINISKATGGAVPVDAWITDTGSGPMPADTPANQSEAAE